MMKFFATVFLASTAAAQDLATVSSMIEAGETILLSGDCGAAKKQAKTILRKSMKPLERSIQLLVDQVAKANPMAQTMWDAMKGQVMDKAKDVIGGAIDNNLCDLLRAVPDALKEDVVKRAVSIVKMLSNGEKDCSKLKDDVSVLSQAVRDMWMESTKQSVDLIVDHLGSPTNNLRTTLDKAHIATFEAASTLSDVVISEHLCNVAFGDNELGGSHDEL